MPLNDPVPSSAFDVAKRNASDLDNLLQQDTGTVETRTGKQLLPWRVAMQRYAAYNNTGAWATGTAYQVNDIWESSGTWYVVLTAYTSGATAGDDIASGNVQVWQVRDFVSGVDTIADLRALEPLLDGQQVELLGHTVAGIGGGIFYADYSDTTSTDNNGTAIVTAGGKRWKRRLDGFVTPGMFGAIGDGVTDDTSAIQNAIDFANTIGGGVVYFPKGEYLVIKESPSGGGTTNPDDYAIHLYGDNVSLLSDGGAKLIRDPLLPRYIMVRWGPLPIVNGQTAYSNSHIRGLEFDGAYSINPSDSPDDMMLLWVHGLKDSSLTKSFIHNSSHYGIGMQNGGRINFTLRDVVVEDTLHDGIDIKNNGSNDIGCVIDNVTVRRFGRATAPTVPFAGIDCMGLVKLSNITVEDFGDIGTVDAGIRFKQGEAVEDRGLGGHGSKLVNFEVRGNSGGSYAFNGVTAPARGVSVSNGEVIGATAAGIRFRQEKCKASQVDVKDSAIGFQVSDSPYTTNGTNCTFVNCSSENSAQYGYRVEVANCEILGCQSDGDDVGLDTRSGGVGTKWVGGSIENSVTSAVVNAGSQTFIEGCRGVKTEARGETSSFPINVPSAINNVSFAHGFGFTPNNYDVRYTLIRSANNVNSAQSVKLSGVDGTNAVAQVRIDVASPTPGDTATLGVYIDGRNIPTGVIS